ncbi:MAG: cytochrome C biosynthesis protein, partial [Rikenellaceae bacterium]
MKNILSILFISTLLCGCTGVQNSVTSDTTLEIYPDYNNVTIPNNIAPLNFKIKEQGEKFIANFFAADTAKPLFKVLSKDGNIIIPTKKWRALLSSSQECIIEISIINTGTTTTYKPIKIDISPDDIDEYLVYRSVKPGYIKWSTMGIYQRSLTSFKVTPIIENSQTGNGCMNCHTFCQNSPDFMMLHFRKEFDGTVVYTEGKAKRLTTKTGSMMGSAVYPSWHPKGRYIAFSTNLTRQKFHTSGAKPIDVYDSNSDIVIYDAKEDKMFTSPLLYNKTMLETFPAWSDDGSYLYFTAAEKLPDDFNPIYLKYNLYRVTFNESNEEFSNLELMVDAAADNKSISFPKSYDFGNYLSYVLSDYGNFSIWHSESDIYTINTSTLESRKLTEICSDNTESYHSYSKNGKWMVFSSRREDGLHTRPYFAHYDSNSNKFSKPFLLPASHPDNYITEENSYN